jgi:hypothetical protein
MRLQPAHEAGALLQEGSFCLLAGLPREIIRHLSLREPKGLEAEEPRALAEELGCMIWCKALLPLDVPSDQSLSSVRAVLSRGWQKVLSV